MLFRLFMFGLLAVLAFRLVKALLRTILTRLILHNSGDTQTGTQKKPPPDLDQTRIKDAEFRDIEP